MRTRIVAFVVCFMPSAAVLSCGSTSSTNADTSPVVASDGGSIADSSLSDAAVPDSSEGGGSSNVAFRFVDTSAGGVDQTTIRDGGVEVHEALSGDVVDVKVTGLAPGSAVTLYARNFGSDSKWYESYATFTANGDGAVDVASAAPSAGTYEGADPDGLFWSGQLKPDPSDTTNDPRTVYFRAQVGGATVATAQLYRYQVARGVTETDVSDNGLVGAFYAPTTGGKHGAVIAFGGSEGGLRFGKFIAAYFASLGYPALGVAYFGADGLPPSLSGVPLEYFQKAHDWLVTRPEVDATRIGVMGVSRGGELALLLGATFPWVTAVVAEEPSGVLWPDDAYGTQTWNTSSWTYQGKALPFVSIESTTPPSTVTLCDGSQAEALAPLYQMSLDSASASQRAAATTPVEKTAGPIFMIAGADDQLDPSCELARISMDRLTQSGHATSHADENHCYQGAGHNASWGPPGAPTASQLSTPFGPTFLMAIGGCPPAIAQAQRDVDTKLRAFLAANLE